MNGLGPTDTVKTAAADDNPTLQGQHGIPVMEIVLARSSMVLIVALATICVRRQDPRGNRRLLLVVCSSRS